MESQKYLRLPFPRVPQKFAYISAFSTDNLHINPEAQSFSHIHEGSPSKPPLPRAATTSPSTGSKSSVSIISHASTLSSLSSNASSDCVDHKDDDDDEPDLAPFGSKDDIERFAKRERASYLRMVQVIGKCCSKKPDERPTAAEVVDMLFSGAFSCFVFVTIPFN